MMRYVKRIGRALFYFSLPVVSLIAMAAVHQLVTGLFR